jgi:hypothetical protein
MCVDHILIKKNLRIYENTQNIQSLWTNCEVGQYYHIVQWQFKERYIKQKKSRE